MSAELPDTHGLGISGDSVFSCLVTFCAFFFSSENVSKIFFNLCKLSCRQYPHTMNSEVKPHIIQKANSFFLDLWAFYLMLLVSKLWFCRPLFHPSLILFFQVEDFWSIYCFLVQMLFLPWVVLLFSASSSEPCSVCLWKHPESIRTWWEIAPWTKIFHSYMKCFLSILSSAFPLSLWLSCI